MPLVEVEHARDHPQRAQRPHAADPEHDLLAQAAIRLGHVQAIGDGAQVGRIGFEVGVEQEQRHAADLRPPDADPHLAVADGRVHLHPFDPAHREVLAAVFEIHFDLAAVGIDLLAPEALLVEEAHRDERQAQVAGGLQVIAGEDAETA